MRTPIDISQVNQSGTYVFYLGFPSMAEGWLPDIQTPRTTQVLGYEFTLTDYTIDHFSKQIIATVKITNLAGTPGYVPADDARFLPNPYAPTVRYGGGWVKAGEGMTDVAPPPDVATVLPVAAILAGVGVLVGVVVLYLSLDKVEKITESPTVQIGIIAAAAVALFFVVKNLKG